MTIRDIAIAFGYKIDENSEKKVEQGIQSLKQKATKLLGAVGVTLSIAGIATGIKDCVALASEVEEMENKFNVVFQGINDEVDAWAQNYSDAIGRNKNDIKTYLADQQNLLVGFGMSREAGAELSKQMTSLSLDLASFGNLDETSAVNAMTKAVMGESEAAKSIGAVLNDATRAEAMHALGLSGTYEKLDQLTKMQVNYQAILSQSSDAVGDCERSLGSYQSTLKQFQAKLKEIKQMVGQFFMPTFQKVLSFGTRGLTRLRDWIQRLSTFINKLGGVERILKVLGAAVAATVVAMNAGKIANFVKSIGTMASNFNLAKLKVLGFLAIFIVLALLIEDFLAFMRGDNSIFGTMLEKAGIDCDKFRKDVIRIWNNVSKALSAVWQGIKNVAIPLFQGIWKAIQTVFSAIGKVIEAVAPQVAEFIDKLANGEIDTAQWVKVGETIAKIAVAIVGVIAGIKAVVGVIKTVTTVVKGVSAAISFLSSPVGLVVLAIAAVIAIVIVCIKHWDKIKAAFIAAWEAIKSAWGSVCDFFQGIWDGIVSVFQEVVSWFSNLFSRAWEAIKGAFSAVGGFFKGVWNGIVSAFEDPKSVLGGYFRVAWAYIKTIWDTVTGYFKAIWETIKGIFSVVKSIFKGDFEGAWDAIKGIIDTWAGYFGKIWDNIKGVFSAVIDWFASIFSAAWEAIKSAFSAVGGFFSGVWDEIVSVFQSVVEWFSGIFSDAWEAIKGIFSTVGEFFQGVWDTIVGLFTSIGTAVSDAISGAVRGAINAVLSGAIGIINGFISTINAAISVINAIPGVEIKKITKLEVPQLAEGGYVEPNKPRPVIVGDNKQEGEIISPISKMKDTVLSALRTFVSGASSLTKARAVSGDSAALAVGGSTSNKTINQNVNISNQFNGDRAGQQKSSEAMDKAAEDSTSQMARALALIRT